VKRYDKNFQRSTIALLAIVFIVAQTRRYTSGWLKKRSSKSVFTGGKKQREKKKDDLSDPPYVPSEEVHKTIRKNKSNCKKTSLKKCVLRMVWLDHSMLLRKSM
jgi:hypothetical protein